MMLINKSTNQIITSKLKVAHSLLDNILGLIKEKEDISMLFYTRFGIHTLFMKQSIDVLVLDQDFKVVQIKKRLLPNRCFFWNPMYSTIIELPSKNTIKVKIGHSLHIN